MNRNAIKILCIAAALLLAASGCAVKPGPGDVNVQTSLLPAPETENVPVSEPAVQTPCTTAEPTDEAPTDAPTEAPQPRETPEPFDFIQDYFDWVGEIGYPEGLYGPIGESGLNQNCFHTPRGTEGYTSGSIVIGDSRCCQLGIYEYRAGRSDFAAFAVWGGHYVHGAKPQIMTDELMAEAENCFREQIISCGRCTIWFFATVNDYDQANNANSGNIRACIAAAERLASMEFELDGRIYRPRVIVIGFDGWRSDGTDSAFAAAFNRFVADYNSALRTAVENSALLSEWAEYFTTVPEITGGADFIDDGLHYGDRTLLAICDFIAGGTD